VVSKCFALRICLTDFRLLIGIDEEQAADIIKEIVSWDLVEILEVSGGTYSNPGKLSVTLGG
jgi:2,4-dienoyl-CoA reductase-like NADH-dependent reductase (Old Yellow Enzyme family)